MSFNKIITSIAVFILVANVSAQKETISAVEVLQKTSDKLSRVKSLNYTLRREINSESIGFHSKSQIEVFLDFGSPDNIIKTKFQMNDPNGIFIFNGSEYFILGKDKTISVVNKPVLKNFEDIPGFYYSPLTLKNSLPTVIKDKSVPKTVTTKNINGKDVYVVEFVLDSKILSLTGDFFPIAVTRNFNYGLTIDKSSYLPLKMHRGNNANSDFVQTNFEYKEDKAAIPSEYSWYYSTYLNEYKFARSGKDRLIKAGHDAPEWSHASLKNDAPVSLSQNKGKVVLVEFWISFCGYCIRAVPKLNEISEKYKNKNFSLIAINANDSKDIIRKFEKNNHVNYQILYGGKETADQYGADGYPTIVLIDKSGNVIYSGPFDPNKTEQLEKLIDRNL